MSGGNATGGGVIDDPDCCAHCRWIGEDDMTVDDALMEHLADLKWQVYGGQIGALPLNPLECDPGYPVTPYTVPHCIIECLTTTAAVAAKPLLKRLYHCG